AARGDPPARAGRVAPRRPRRRLAERDGTRRSCQHGDVDHPLAEVGGQECLPCGPAFLPASSMAERAAGQPPRSTQSPMVDQSSRTVSSKPLPAGTLQLWNPGSDLSLPTNAASSPACVVVLSVTSTQ